MDHPEFSEQGHTEKSQVVDDEAGAVCPAQLEALCWYHHKGEHQAQSQGSSQDPHQQTVRLQLMERQRDTE